jgi:hypothetical protein
MERRQFMLFVSTTPELFGRWLKAYTASDERQITVGGSLLTLQPAIKKGTIQEPDQWYIAGIGGQIRPELGPSRNLGRKRVNCIHFHAIPLDGERCQVQVTCTEADGVLSYTGKLLLEIERRWRGSMDYEWEKHDLYGLVDKDTLLDLQALQLADFLKRLLNNAAIAGERPNGLHTGFGPRPGRPSYPDDDWAFTEISGGRNPSEVYREWTQRPGVRERESQDRETFDAAIRRRKKKRPTKQ